MRAANAGVASADERDRILEPVADALFAVAGLTAGLRVLDIGCGCGVTTLRAAGLVGVAGSATGIDLSRPMLDLARQRADLAGAANAGFVQGDGQTQTFDPASVDVIIGRFGTMFFSDPVAAFTNIGTALRPGGRLRPRDVAAARRERVDHRPRRGPPESHGDARGRLR